MSAEGYATGTPSPGGWTCGACKAQVPSGVLHICPSGTIHATAPAPAAPTTWRTTFPAAQPSPELLERIASALERIALALDREDEA